MTLHFLHTRFYDYLLVDRRYTCLNAAVKLFGGLYRLYLMNQYETHK